MAWTWEALCVAGAAGAAARCTAAGEGGEGQNKRQGEGSQTFQRYESFLISMISN